MAIGAVAGGSVSRWHVVWPAAPVYQRVFRYALAGLIALGCAACGGVAGEPATATLPPTQPTATATAAPASPPATASPAPIETPTETPAGPRAVVGNTDGEGANLRREPAGEEIIRGLSEGTEVVPTGQRATAGGREWVEVRDLDGNVGWIAAEFVVTEG